MHVGRCGLWNRWVGSCHDTEKETGADLVVVVEVTMKNLLLTCCSLIEGEVLAAAVQLPG